jgi:hypothetical protein
MTLTPEQELVAEIWRSRPRHASQIIKREFKNTYDLVDSLHGNSFSEKCWLFLNNMNSVPTCGHCGVNKVKYLDMSRGYAQFCSVSCMARSSDTAEKKKATCETKYGVEHFSQTDSYRNQYENTMMAKYGVRNAGQIIDLLDDRSRKKQETFWNSLIESLSGVTLPNHTFEEYTHVRDKELSWKCAQCDKIFNSYVFGVTPKCPVCWPRPAPGAQSRFERELIHEIKKIYSGEIIENSRQLIAPKELDIYIPEFKFAIEMNGMYWHSDIHLDKYYHQKKFELCRYAGIKLLMINEHEWMNNRTLVMDMIRHRVGIRGASRIPARKTVATEISYQEASDFLEGRHISGKCRGNVYVGLKLGTKLMAVSVFGKNRFKDGDKLEYELIRFAVDGEVTGALGKMLKYFINSSGATKIVSYADLRYGRGEVYVKNNFTLTSTTKPGYWYYLSDKIYHRLSWTKAKLVKAGHDSNLTEHEIMRNIGALRFYDCGHNYYELVIKNDKY